ncbi:hypothetical protein BASA81_011271 [Batrachochytrium salamandrivorans]|nr:hypothetical protein BASA81_011271 [Batrachochytrium salamandrivorans]
MASHETLPDGTKVSTSANGTVLKVFPDGTKIQTTREGVELTIRPDGTKEQKNARGVRVVTFVDGRTIQTNPDGVSIEISPDKKTRVQRNTDGSEILVRPDGSKLQKMADGSEYEVGADGKKTQTKLARVAAPAAVAAPGVAASRATAPVPGRVLSPPPPRDLPVLPTSVLTEDQQFTKVAAEHARMLVRSEAEKDKLAVEKRDLEHQHAKLREQLDAHEQAKLQLLAQHEQDLSQQKQTEAELLQQIEVGKQEAANIQTEFDNYKQSVLDKDTRVAEMEQQLQDMWTREQQWQQDQQEMQAEVAALNARLESSILGGSSAADKLAELKFARAMAEERANVFQEEVLQLKQEFAEYKQQHELEREQLSNSSSAAAEAAAAAGGSHADAGELEMLHNQKESLEMELEMQRNETLRIQSELDEVMSNHNQSSLLNSSIATANANQEVVEELNQAKLSLSQTEKLAKDKQKRIEQLESQLRVAKLEKEEIRLKMEMLDFPVSTGTPNSSIAAADGHRSARLQEEIDAEKKKRREKEDEVDQAGLRYTELQTQVSKLELELETEKKQHEITVTSLEREKEELVEMAKSQAEGAKQFSPKVGQEQKKSFFSKVMKAKPGSGGHGSGGDKYDLESEVRELHLQVSERERELELQEQQIKKLDKAKTLEVDEVKHKLLVVEKRCEELKTELETRPFRTVGGGESGNNVAALEVELASVKVKLEMAEEKYNLSQMRTLELEEKMGSAPDLGQELDVLHQELLTLQAHLGQSEREKIELQNELGRLQQERERLVQQHKEEKLYLLQQQQQQQHVQPVYATADAGAVPYTSRGSGGFSVPSRSSGGFNHAPVVAAPAVSHMVAPTPAGVSHAPVAPTSRSSGGFVDPLEAIKAKKAAEAAAAANNRSAAPAAPVSRPVYGAPAPAPVPPPAAAAPAPRVNKLADRMKMFEKN